MPGCAVNQDASPQFKTLCEHWKRNYPHINEDLQQAFRAIAENISAKKARRVQAGPIVEVYKYRQSSSDIKRGDRYGWRIYALYEKTSGIMYPIIVYPKPVWDNADDATVTSAIREIRIILGYCVSTVCDGRMNLCEPPEKRSEGNIIEVKTQCGKCGAVHWKPEPA